MENFMRQLKVKVTGISPLLMHKDTLANPLDPLTKAHKELTGKRKKTDADHEAIAKSEWLAGIYWSEKSGVYIPPQNFEATFVNAAKLQKLGKKFQQAVMVVEDELPLTYKGPRTLEELFAQGFLDMRSVKVQTAKLMRCRPKFNNWSVEMTLAFNEEVVNVEEVKKAILDGGSLIGVCAYRPRFGKFSSEVVAV
jgi:hypothetical protein